MSTRGASGDRRAFALPLILFLLLALTFLAHGTLLLSQRELHASRSFFRATQAREAARSALGVALDLSEALEEVRAKGEGGVLFREWVADDVWRSVSARWMTSEMFFLEGEGGTSGWPGVKRFGGVGWRMDPVERIGSFQGGVELGGVLLAQSMEGLSATRILDPPEGWEAADCAVYRPVLDSLFAGRSFPLSHPLPEAGGSEAGDIPSLGLLDGSRLLERTTDPGSGGTGRIGEREAGCPETPGPVAWGTPDSLTLREGQICGLVVVGGDLILEGDVRLQGVALVGGSLIMSGSSTLQGMARVRESVTLVGSSSFDVSACAALMTLSEVESLRDPFLLPSASNIRSF